MWTWYIHGFHIFSQIYLFGPSYFFQCTPHILLWNLFGKVSQMAVVVFPLCYWLFTELLGPEWGPANAEIDGYGYGDWDEDDDEE